MCFINGGKLYSSMLNYNISLYLQAGNFHYSRKLWGPAVLHYFGLTVTTKDRNNHCISHSQSRADLSAAVPTSKFSKLSKLNCEQVKLRVHVNSWTSLLFHLHMLSFVQKCFVILLPLTVFCAPIMCTSPFCFSIRTVFEIIQHHIHSDVIKEHLDHTADSSPLN